MRARFVRTEGQRDRVYVTRTDGTETSWAFPSYGDALPHDLVHLVVEAAFGVRRGFWGRVDEGLDVARINAQANRAGGKDKYVGFGEDLRELFVAEGLAGVGWLADEAFGDGLAGVGWLADERTPDEQISAVADACRRMSVEPPSMSPARIAQTRAVLTALTTKWRTLVPKGALDLSFDASDLEATFRALAST
jgi:hypothetical protein